MSLQRSCIGSLPLLGFTASYLAQGMYLCNTRQREMHDRNQTVWQRCTLVVHVTRYACIAAAQQLNNAAFAD